MAGFNEILVGRYNRMLQKLLSMKGPASMNALSTELYSTLPFFNGIENRYLEGWNTFWTGIALGPTPANNNAVQWRNPVGSKVIVVLESLQAQDSVAQIFSISVKRPSAVGDDLATAMVSFGMDARMQVNASSLILTQTSAAVTPSFTNVVQQMITVSNASSFETIVHENQEILILPGDAFRIVTSTVNSASRWNIRWRERLLEESETQ